MKSYEITKLGGLFFIEYRPPGTPRLHSIAGKTSTKGTMDPEGSARNSCNSWLLYAR